MPQTQVIDPRTLKEFLILHQGFLRPKFPDAKISSKRGRPRIGLRWVVVAICVFARVDNIVWRDLPSKLWLCDFLIEEGYLKRIPSKSTFHSYWNLVSKSSLESWIRMSGHAFGSSEDTDAAIDSSGFELITGSFWRLVKWGGKTISKTSNIFCKAHIAVALPSRAIVGITTSKSTDHDAVKFGSLWMKMYKQVTKKLRRVHLDKTYWSSKIINFLHQEQIKAIIPCKSNSIDHGTGSPMDQQVHMQKKMPGLYRINNKTYLRAEVEHVFGEIKQFHTLLRDTKRDNKLKTLLSSFLWYNHKIMVQGVSY
ncbi:MAG: transposase [Candidatus Heimdallarchaeota archaeon]